MSIPGSSCFFAQVNYLIFLFLPHLSNLLKTSFPLQVKPYNTEFLTVGSAEKIDPQKKFFLVKLTDKYWKEADLTTPLNVVVVSEITEQNIEASKIYTKMY